MQLSEVANTFGSAMRQRYGFGVHKLALNVGFTCPNRDGTKGRNGCTFCNNLSFSSSASARTPIAAQIAAGTDIIRRLTGATRYLAYFQSYTNTYGTTERLRELYDEALAAPGVIGLAIGTRPDCVSDEVLDLLQGYRDRGHEIWLELGLQSAFDQTLQRINRGHTFSDYRNAVIRARIRGLQVCTHLIVGLPGEHASFSLLSLERVLEYGVDGLKIHPLHVVKGTALASEWRSGAYSPLEFDEYVETAAEIVRCAPPEVIFHRLTGTASKPLLLAPDWCEHKWNVLNGITRRLWNDDKRIRHQY